ncbi:MAG: TOMM precursor leader peptide-binding protein [Allosphingosinicella sp.]
MTLIVHQGQFGREVARRLETESGSSLSLGEFLASPPPIAADDSLYLVSGTPAYDAFRRFARIVGAAGARWTLGYLNGPQAICGPTFGPSPGPCFECFLKRILSHAGALSSVEQELALGHFYSADLSRDHPGYAATAAWAMAEECRRVVEDGERGRLIRFGLLEVETTAGRIIPVHGCPRCRPGSSGSRRFVERIKAILPAGNRHGD